MADIVIAGYLGFENSGDEALLGVVLSEINRRLPGRSVTVLSRRPRETSARYGVCAIGRYDLFAIISELRRSRVFVFGGGSLIQDATSRRSFLYYLSLLQLAKRCGTRTMLFANGIGPLLRTSSRRDASRVLSEVDVITLRDHDSEKLLSRIGVSGPKVTVTSDTAFMLGGCMIPSGRDAEFAGVPAGAPYAVISVRDASVWEALGGRSRTSFSDSAASLCRRFAGVYGIAPLLVPMQYPRDLRTIYGIARCADVPVYIWDAPFSACDACGVLGGAEMAVGMRLHMLIYSAIFGTPMLGVSYDPKVEVFCRDMGVPFVGIGADAEELCLAADGVLSERDAYSERVYAKVREMAMRASGTVDILAELFYSADACNGDRTGYKHAEI